MTTTQLKSTFLVRTTTTNTTTILQGIITTNLKITATTIIMDMTEIMSENETLGSLTIAMQTIQINLSLMHSISRKVSNLKIV
jgi:hypothetical protein